MREITLQIKPVGNNCNICCSYCYAAPFKSKKFKILDLELLDKLIKNAFEISNNIIITWHGGEPTMAGVKYFKEYMKIVKKYKKPHQVIRNMIQTNATLITEEFATFLKQNKFIVSVSLDGNEKTHNINRYDYRKIGSFNRTMKGIENLRKVGINPPIIATVSKSTYDYGTENFHFFIKNGFKEIKYSPVYDSDTDSFSINDEMWYNYIINIFNEWISLHDKTIKIREIDEILMWISNSTLPLCTSRGSCVNWISINENGDIYPCEYLRSNNYYGNISTTSLTEVFKSQNYVDFKKKINYIPEECKTCKLYSMCHNGCPATRVNGNELKYDGKYVYCNVRKKMYEKILTMLSQ